jgi:hypothetical protein
MLFQICEQLVNEWVKKELLGYIIMLVKNSPKSTHDHFSSDLIDFFVTSFAIIVLQQTANQCLVDSACLRVILRSKSVQ